MWFGAWQRFCSYIANEYIVDALANNRFFQRFVIRTNETVKKGATRIQQKLQGSEDQIHSRLSNSNPNVARFTSAFFNAFTSEVSKQIRKRTGGRK
jgi:hypothetical protein